VCLFILFSVIYFVFLVIPNGILAVNYLDANNDDFGISYQILDITGGIFHNNATYRTITGNINWLRRKWLLK